MHRLTPLLIVLMVSCHPKVINYLSPTAKFSAYDSYMITNVKIRNAEISEDGQSIMKSIENAAKEEMGRRSYELSNVSPDLVLRYEIISNQVTDVNTNNNYGYGYGFRPYYYPYNTITVRTFLESAILFELRDMNNDKAIWNASVDLNQYKKGKNTNEIIQTAVKNIFETYPYRAGSSQPDESLISK